jgi:hypothetical protein
MAEAYHQNRKYPYTKKNDNTKPEGKRRVGRPKFRWLYDVQADIKSVDVKRWRLKAEDRKELRAILREAKLKWPLSHITVRSVLHVAP